MRSARRRLATIALVGLLGAACGSDGGQSVPTVPTTPPPPPSPVPTTIGTTTDTPTDAATDLGPPQTEAPPVAPTTAPARPLEDVALDLRPLGTFDSPIALTWRPGHPGLVYLAERAGRVRALDITGTTDQDAGEVVLDISSATTTESERGLLGLAFNPLGDRLYVSYTDSEGTTTIDEYGVVDDGTVDTESKRNILSQPQPFSNHNGGGIAFGPDGYLYLGLGDGGAANDPERNALDLTTLLGKLIRIDPSQPSDGFPYTIPADNPFVGDSAARPEIWSYGLRNPWRFSFDRATGDLWIGDVGQNEWEEIDLAYAANGAGKGSSFGWSAWEGNHPFNDDQPSEGHVAPLIEYRHGDAGCSVTGGSVYRGVAIPDLVGVYLYGDYCSGRVWGLRVEPDGSISQHLMLEVPVLVSFGEDAEGELYAVSLGGTVSRLVAG